MPENVINIANKGFEVLNKVVDKTSPKFKSYNLIPVGIGILAVYLVVFIVCTLSEINDTKTIYITFTIISVSILLIYTVAFIFQDYLSVKRQETNMMAYNQQYKNRS